MSVRKLGRQVVWIETIKSERFDTINAITERD